MIHLGIWFTHVLQQVLKVQYERIEKHQLYICVNILRSMKPFKYRINIRCRILTIKKRWHTCRYMATNIFLVNRNSLIPQFLSYNKKYYLSPQSNFLSKTHLVTNIRLISVRTFNFLSNRIKVILLFSFNERVIKLWFKIFQFVWGINKHSKIKKICHNQCIWNKCPVWRVQLVSS